MREKDGSLHLRKCRIKQKQKCKCLPPPFNEVEEKELTPSERRQQRKFLKKHTNPNTQGKVKIKLLLMMMMMMMMMMILMMMIRIILMINVDEVDDNIGDD